MIDSTKEELIPLTKARKYAPRRHGDKPTHASTIFRWATRGSRGVRLETLRTPGGLCTTREAIARFFEALTTDAVAPRTAAAARRTHDAAAAELAAMGI